MRVSKAPPGSRLEAREGGGGGGSGGTAVRGPDDPPARVWSEGGSWWAGVDVVEVVEARFTLGPIWPNLEVAARMVFHACVE